MDASRMHAREGRLMAPAIGSSAPLAPILDDGPAISRAMALWLAGHDTHEIAELLHQPEAAVFNSLNHIRELRRAA